MNTPQDVQEPAGPGRLRRSLDTLRVKLFLAIAGANIVLVMAAYLIYSWSFDSGLVDYLNKSDEARLTPVVTRLAEGYHQHGSWDWLTRDPQQWPDLLREELGGGRLPRGRPDDSRSGNSPSNLPPLTFDPRMLLFDAQGQVLIGSIERAPQAIRKPIHAGGRLVGYLGYLPRLQMVTSLERVFSSQQSRRFGAIAIGMLAAVLVNAALIAQWLARRLRALSAGATALAKGDYSTRIRIEGGDELARLGGDFNRLAVALEAAQRARQQWIADIAHELRTPLATLRAEIEALEDGVRPLTREGVTSLAQEVGQLTRLVEDLRMLSLSDLGALSYQKENTDLGEVIEDVLAAHRNAITERGLQLDIELGAPLPILADGARLAQIFGNLLQNTLRYSDAPGTLRVRATATANVAEVTWEDSAPGVEPQELARLTDRLYRIDGSRARSSGGSGLGLAIVKAIVEAHDGSLTPGLGALGGLRWTLRFPSQVET